MIKPDDTYTDELEAISEPLYELLLQEEIKPTDVTIPIVAILLEKKAAISSILKNLVLAIQNQLRANSITPIRSHHTLGVEWTNDFFTKFADLSVKDSEYLGLDTEEAWCIVGAAHVTHLAKLFMTTYPHIKRDVIKREDKVTFLTQKQAEFKAANESFDRSEHPACLMFRESPKDITTDNAHPAILNYTLIPG